MANPTTKLQKRLQEELDGKSVQQVADGMGIPYWVVRDTARGATDCPRGLYLPGMARYFDISVEQLIDEAYAPIGSDRPLAEVLT